MAVTRASRPVIFQSEIDRIIRQPGGPVGVRVRRLALDIAAEGERLALAELGNRHPSDRPRTGRYARSFAVKVRRDPDAGFQFEVSNTAAYSAIIELGSKPHKIEARNVKYLVFRSRQTGQIRRVRTVNHHGTAPMNILWRATESVVRGTLNF